MQMNLQLFGGRGAGGGWTVTGGVGAGDILETRSLISERGGNQELVDETLSVFKDVHDEYGVQVNDIQIAKMKAGSDTMAYFDSDGNIAINEAYFNKGRMEAAYKKCVESGYHPSNGNKTATQAVAAHELGHKLTEAAGTKLKMAGFGNIDKAANAILTEARKTTRHRSNAQMAGKISGYAKTKPAEAVAEAFADVYCNGKNARSESKAIVTVMNKYL